MSKGKGGALLSKGNLIKMGVTVAVGAFIMNKLAEAAAGQPSMIGKVAGVLGYKGPGTV